MAITNRERVGKALDLLRVGLAPFVEREVQGGRDHEAIMRAIARHIQHPALGIGDFLCQSGPGSAGSHR